MKHGPSEILKARQPIPRPLWDRMVKFLDSGATGQIVLDVHTGQVCALACTDRLRHHEDPITPVDVQGIPPLTTR